MFCKWCGEPVKIGRVKCQSCGRDLPPLSECGGFYNLVPEARSKPPISEPLRPVRQEAIANGKDTPPQPKKKRKTSHLYNTVSLVAILIGLVLIILAYLSTNKKLSSLEAQSDSVIKQVSTLQAESVLSERNIAVEISFEGLNGSTGMSVDYDLQGFSSDVGSKLCTEAGENCKTYIAECRLGSDTALTVTLKQEETTEETVAFCAGYDIANTELLGEQSEMQYIWQWRENENNPWEAISSLEGWENAVSVTSDSQSSKLNILSCAELADLFRCNTPELRCVIIRENRNGGSLTVSIGAFSVALTEDTPPTTDRVVPGIFTYKERIKFQ